MARKAKIDSGPPPSPVDQEKTRQAFKDDLKELDHQTEIARAAQAKVRATKKRLLSLGKALGFDPSQVDWAIQARKQEPEDIDRETRKRTEMARLLSIPLGTQLGLDFDGVSVATKIDTEALAAAKEAEKETIWSQAAALEQANAGGYKSGQQGMAEDDNPYPADDKPAEHDEWKRGWKLGVSAAAAAVKTGGRKTRGRVAELGASH
ncbi:MAG: hypothetical protein EAZ99_07825 [Alphaproteobacteria bacterium]|nr:MAG: hypothetical protein EAZ99_07825 [Alphaproteobacteria bacterium]